MTPLEGVVRIYNRSEKIVNDLINGTRVIVPPHGSVETSARRAQAMLDRHPGVLTQDASYARQTLYTDKDFDMLEELDEVHLRALLHVLMSGGVADIEEALKDQLSCKEESNKRQ